MRTSSIGLLTALVLTAGLNTFAGEAAPRGRGPQFQSQPLQPQPQEQRPLVDVPRYDPAVAPATYTQPVSSESLTVAVPAENPTAHPSGHAPLLLPKRGVTRTSGSDAKAEVPHRSVSPATVVASLTLVLGLFFAATWVLKRGLPAAMRQLPTEAVEVLGRTALVGKQQVALVRCGNKLLLVALGANGADTLTEITDPVEVDRMAGLCRQRHPFSATASFRQVMTELEGDRTTPASATRAAVQSATKREATRA